MHGFLWVLHEDHHHPKGRGLQKNDLFSLFFATVSFLLIYNGMLHQWEPVAAAGFGVALYGVGYTPFHEIMFHRRIPGIRFRPQNPYLKRIIHAHHEHHRHSGKSGSTAFSFLYAPPRFKVPEG